MVAASLAIPDDAFRLDVLLVTLLAAIAIQVGVNFANDLADAARGADTETRIGPTRAVAAGLITPRQMRNGMIAAFGFAALGGIYLWGGIIRKLLPRAAEGPFLDGFLDVGRFGELMGEIPVRAVLDAGAALTGAAQVAARLAE